VSGRPNHIDVSFKLRVSSEVGERRVVVASAEPRPQGSLWFVVRTAVIAGRGPAFESLLDLDAHGLQPLTWRGE
jgi:hypothetical protein